MVGSIETDKIMQESLLQMHLYNRYSMRKNDFDKAEEVRNREKTIHLHLFDDSFQLSDLALYCLLVGQDEVDFLGDLVL